MTRRKALDENPHVWVDEGEVASAATPRRGPLLCTKKILMFSAVLAAALPLVADEETIGGYTWTC